MDKDHSTNITAILYAAVQISEAHMGASKLIRTLATILSAESHRFTEEGNQVRAAILGNAAHALQYLMERTEFMMTDDTYALTDQCPQMRQWFQNPAHVRGIRHDTVYNRITIKRKAASKFAYRVRKGMPADLCKKLHVANSKPGGRSRISRARSPESVSASSV